MKGGVVEKVDEGGEGGGGWRHCVMLLRLLVWSVSVVVEFVFKDCGWSDCRNVGCSAVHGEFAKCVLCEIWVEAWEVNECKVIHFVDKRMHH